MKKRILALFLSLALVLCCIPNVVHAEEETTDYIEIRTAKDLYKVRSDLTANYKLMNDIDLTEDTAPGGAYDFNGCGWNPIGSNNTYSDTPFTGVFDGQGHTINGMRIHVEKEDVSVNNYVGLFSRNEGTIKNVILENASVYFSSSKSIHNIYAAAVTGINTGTIENVQVKGGSIYARNIINYGDKKTKTSTTYYISASGVANGANGTLIDCYNDASVDANGSYGYYDYFDSYTYKKTYYYDPVEINVSGIRGGTVSRCINRGIITGLESVDYRTVKKGGILASTIDNCFDASNLGEKLLGTVTNSYYLSDKTAGIVGYYKGDSASQWIGLNETQMQDPDSFEGFDFENTWRMSEETVYKYPQLRSIRNGVTKVEIISEPTNEIVVGTELKYEGAVARIYREDGTAEDVELTPENTEGGDTKTTGKKTVTYSYRGASASFEIDVVPVKITELEIKSLPTKTEYVTGQAFSSDGLVINAKYNNGTVTKCNDYYLDSDELDITTAGEKTLTASYNGVKVSFNVTYIAKQITDLKLTQAPDKTTYDEGQAFDPTGMVVTAYYNDDTSAEVTDYSVGVMTGYGDVKIPVSFEGKTVYASVYIRKLVKELSLEQNVLNLYETDEAELKVMAVPEDADNQDFVWTSSNDDVVTVDKTGKVTAVSEGKAEVTVTIENYPGLSCTCEVNVTAIKPVSLSIVQMPTEVNYLEGENFISDGLIVNLNYNSGKSVVCSAYSVRYAAEIGDSIQRHNKPRRSCYSREMLVVCGADEGKKIR